MADEAELGLLCSSPDPTSDASACSPTPATRTLGLPPATAGAGGASVTNGKLPASSSSSASPTATTATSQKKRASTSSATGANDANAPPKVTKRRAARACVSCRARKVRCDVVEGAPCGNCRWDNVECVVQESRRRRKNLLAASTAAHVAGAEAQLRTKTAAGGHQPIAISSSADLRRSSDEVSVVSLSSIDRATGGLDLSVEGHVPHMIYQRQGYRSDSSSVLPAKLPSADASQQQQLHQHQQQQQQQQRRLLSNLLGQASLFGDVRTAQFLNSLEDFDLAAQLPAFVRPLPARIASDDVRYLYAKGALTLPPEPLQNALLQAYVEYVHPYMPLMDLFEFLGIVNARDGLHGQVSLFLYQAIMFSATAFVDIQALREAGYPTRKAARKAFFQKTRLLYDFDYESDRLILVQALLLMTYWYETPDDQKDTWHWMGVAISLAHTIGLHRNPAVMGMPPRRQKLWKRVWWSCFMRDRLVALGMRRPTRIKDEDFDVPMLDESDFEIELLPDDNTVVPPECTLLRDLSMQRELAVLCIAKAQLCICVSHMLKAQYSVLIREKLKPENTVNSTMMLFPNKKMDNMESVNSVDLELLAWADSLPPQCQYRPLSAHDIEGGRSTIAVQRTLLHMVYYTTISALHRPQFLPSSPASAPQVSRQVQEMSRLRVRDAAAHTTRMAAELHKLRLERFLPTTGVTVMLPAMIIHLLEMKNPIPQARERATRGFRQCMKVLEKLREIYAAADFATGFLEAALRKAAIDMTVSMTSPNMQSMHSVNVKPSALQFSAQTPPPENAPYMTSSESLFASAAARPSRLAGLGHHVGPSLMTPLTAAPMDFSAAVAGATSPPQTETERDLESAAGGLTPSASGASDDQAPLESMDIEGGFEYFMPEQRGGEFDWNAVTGTDFDVDQWLQFPTEGVPAPGIPGVVPEDTLMSGVYGDDMAEGGTPQTVPPNMTPEQALTWAMSAELAQDDQTMGMDLEAHGEVAVEA